ncbi:UNVERIFIED_CONTAM: Chloride channel protein CLC-c, partial [Sesamum radiatum]
MDHSDDDDYNIQGGEGGDVESGGGGRSGFIERRESNMSSFSEAAREPLLHLKSRVNTTSQIAIVGSKVYPVESLDYEIFENELIKQDWRSRKRVEIFQYIFLKWTLALSIGLFTGLVGFFNNIAVENIAGFKLLLTSNLMLKA